MNNSGRSYFVQVSTGVANDTNRFQAIRVFYTLQVSAPSMGPPVFADVPDGHGQRQFIEALAAAGITGGCGGGNYCPDAPLTRGQMAVFLTVALGLHFPN